MVTFLSDYQFRPYGPKTNLRPENVTSRKKRARTFFVGPQGQTNDRSILLKVQTNKKNFVPVRFPIFIFRPLYSPLLHLSQILKKSVRSRFLYSFFDIIYNLTSLLVFCITIYLSFQILQITVHLKIKILSSYTLNNLREKLGTKIPYFPYLRVPY